MPSRISNPSAGGTVIGKFNIGEGGHGKTTALEGLVALGGFPLPSVGQPLNPIPLDGDGNIANAYFGGLTVVETGIEGPTVLSRGSLGLYHLTTFDVFEAYHITCSEGGEVWRDGRIVYFRAPIEIGEAWISVAARKFTIDVVGTKFVQPTITSPEALSETNETMVTITGSTAVIENNPGTELHTSTDFELSKTEDFSVAYRANYRSTNLHQWQVTGLDIDVDYYARVRHNGINEISEWSEPLQFRVATVKTITKPVITSPADLTFGVALDAVIQGTAFQTAGYEDTHVSTDMMISTTQNFTNVVMDVQQSTTQLTSLPLTGLVPVTLYYARMRYRGESGRVSDWSNAISFITNFE